jgi:hypothetical protein
VAQEVEHLLSRHKARSSLLSTTTNKQTKIDNKLRDLFLNVGLLGQMMQGTPSKIAKTKIVGPSQIM